MEAGYLRTVFRNAPNQTRYEEIAGPCAILARKLCRLKLATCTGCPARESKFLLHTCSIRRPEGTLVDWSYEQARL